MNTLFSKNLALFATVIAVSTSSFAGGGVQPPPQPVQPKPFRGIEFRCRTSGPNITVFSIGPLSQIYTPVGSQDAMFLYGKTSFYHLIKRADASTKVIEASYVTELGQDSVGQFDRVSEEASYNAGSVKIKVRQVVTGEVTEFQNDFAQETPDLRFVVKHVGIFRTMYGNADLSEMTIHEFSNIRTVCSVTNL